MNFFFQPHEKNNKISKNTSTVLYKSILHLEERKNWDLGQDRTTDHLIGSLSRARGADFQVGGLMRMRKREPTRGVRGHAPLGKFEILFF